MSQTLVKIRSSELRSKKASGVAAPAEAHLSPRHMGQTNSKQTKTDVIRSLPATLSPTEVVEAAKKLGVVITPNLVSLVRGRDRRNPGPPRRRGRPRKDEVLARTAVTAKPGGAKPSAHKAPAKAPSRAHVVKVAAHPKVHAAAAHGLTNKEKELAGILFEVGLDRVLELVQQLKRALVSVN